MDGPLVNDLVSELVKFTTGGAGQCEMTSQVQKPQQSKMDDDYDIPKMTNDELVQLQDQMRKVHFCAVLIYSLKFHQVDKYTIFNYLFTAKNITLFVEVLTSNLRPKCQ